MSRLNICLSGVIAFTALFTALPRTASSKPASPAKPGPLPPARTVTSSVRPAAPAPLRNQLPPRLLNRRSLLTSRSMGFRGARYRYGSASPRATDCSGLTMQLYRSVGIKLPRSSRAQFKVGKSVPRNALLPGDLVFFRTRGGISHVGMFIGNNKMIHAVNPSRGIRIDSLGSSYYHRRYAGARRLLPEGAPVPLAPANVPMGNGEPPAGADDDDAPVAAAPPVGRAVVAGQE